MIEFFGKSFQMLGYGLMFAHCQDGMRRNPTLTGILYGWIIYLPGGGHSSPARIVSNNLIKLLCRGLKCVLPF